jgi:hypothetical protein
MQNDTSGNTLKGFATGLFVVIFLLNVAQLFEQASNYNNAKVLLQMFVDRPVANDNETFVNNLAEQKATALQNVVMIVVELSLISGLWIFYRKRK